MHTKRVIIGLSVAIVAASIIFFAPGFLHFLVLLAFALASQAEFYALAKSGKFRVYDKLGLILGGLCVFLPYLFREPALTPGTAHPAIPEWQTALIVICCFVVMMRTMFDLKTKDAFSSACITLAGILYVPFMLSYLMRLAQWDTPHFFATTRGGMFLVFFTAMVIKMSDTGAFAIGIPFGKHKMFPRISPKKSWEGLAGGLVAGVGTGFVLAALASKYQWGPDGVFFASSGVPSVSICTAAFISAVLVIIGVFGDLIESMFKRAVNIKDSSLIFPSMGGLLDVADSLIFAAPCMYYMLLWL